MYSLPQRGTLFDRAACASLGGDRFDFAQYDRLEQRDEGGVLRADVIRCMEAAAEEAAAETCADADAEREADRSDCVIVGSMLRVSLLDVDAHIVVSPKSYVVECIARARHAGIEYAQLRFVQDNSVVARKLRDFTCSAITVVECDSILAARREAIVVEDASARGGASSSRRETATAAAAALGPARRRSLKAAKPKKPSWAEMKKIEAKREAKRAETHRKRVVEDAGARWAEYARNAAPTRAEGDAIYAEIMAVPEPELEKWVRVEDKKTKDVYFRSVVDGKRSSTNTPRRRAAFKEVMRRASFEREAERRRREGRTQKARWPGWRANDGEAMRWWWEEKCVPCAEDDEEAIARFRKLAYAAPDVESVNALLRRHVGANGTMVPMSKRAVKSERHGSNAAFWRRYAIANRCDRGCNVVAPVLQKDHHGRLPRRTFDARKVRGHIYASTPSDDDSVPRLTPCPVGQVMNVLVTAFIRNRKSSSSERR